MALYFIRHGQTEFNKKGIVQGCSAGKPLNETGIQQARETKEKLKDLVIDKIYCSPLERARQTCDIVNELWNAPITYEDRLKERNFGNYEGIKLPPELFLWSFKQDYHDAKAENLDEFFNRVQSFLKEIKSEGKDKNILIVAHGGVYLASIAYFKNIPCDDHIRDNMLMNGDYDCLMK